MGTAETFEVNYFQNYASQSPGSTFDPGLDRDFTLALQDLILTQTSLDLVTSNGDLLYEGEIVEYRVSPMTATAEQRAAQNRLTISVRVKYTNVVEPDLDFDQTFSRYEDYDASQNLTDVENALIEVIVENLVEDIFNRAFISW